MKKFLTWILNHMVLILGVITLLVTAAIVGTTMLNSYNSYKAYEDKYNATDLDVRSLAAAQPKFIEFKEGYKSSYKNALSLAADQLTVKTSQEEYLVNDYIDLTQSGGSVSISLELKEKSFLDIDFVLSSEYEEVNDDGDTLYGVTNLLSNVSFIVNGETMEEEIDLPNSGNGQEWHHLVMGGFALPVGPVTVEIKNNSGKKEMMPQIQSISLFSSQVLSEPAEEAAE